MVSKTFFSPSILFHLELQQKEKYPWSQHDRFLDMILHWKIFHQQWQIQRESLGGPNPRPPPFIRPDLLIVWDWSSSSTESYITDFFNETRHNPRYWKLKLFWGTLFWVPASACEAVLTAPTATGLHTLVFFNRNNSTPLKNSYMFSAISLAFLSSLICVDCIRNTSAIIFVHEKWLTNGKQVFPSTAF